MSSREHTKDVIDTDCMRNLTKNLSAPNSIYHVLCQSWIWYIKYSIIFYCEDRNKAKNDANIIGIQALYIRYKCTKV